ncbi:MAG: hypothetical protein GF350_11090 [Chitinivibrionales bacterium]|nr:hypothetical protein [Chitinivibrionales bacterium]
MSENSEKPTHADQNADESHQKDTLGDVLRKERITKRITIETIARDLKLNVKYIKALEANDYESLPADPYVRVYLKSLSKYLMLDSDTILHQYYRERGIPPESYTRDTSTKLDLTGVEPETNNRSWVAIVGMAAVLAVIFIIAGMQGWLSSPGTNRATTVPADTAAATSGLSDTAAGGLAASRDTAGVGEARGTETGKGPAGGETGEAGDTAARAESEQSGAMTLILNVTDDSSWVQVFSDGESWKNTLYENDTRTFTAQDSFNVHVGNNSAIEYYLNDARLEKFSDKSVVAFKIDNAGGIERWPLSKWNTVFSERQ